MDSHKQGGAKVVDAAQFSPAQIKAMLDIMPFDQKKEDIYRGFDGRNVPDQQLWDPSEDFRPKRPTEEEKQEILLKIARSKRAGTPVDKELCGLKHSNYDLDPDSGKI
jgi:hypothetical protein